MYIKMSELIALGGGTWRRYQPILRSQGWDKRVVRDGSKIINAWVKRGDNEDLRYRSEIIKQIVFDALNR